MKYRICKLLNHINFYKNKGRKCIICGREQLKMNVIMNDNRGMYIKKIWKDYPNGWININY